MKILRRAALGSVVVLILLVAGIWIYLFDHYVHPARIPIDGSPLEFGLQFREVKFVTTDNVEIVGWLITPPNYTGDKPLPAVITVHGYATNRWDIIERSVYVARAGYLVLTFDQRACGVSGGTAVTGGALETLDLKAAIEFLLKQPEVDRDRLGIYGYSVGGAIAINVSADEKSVKVLVVDSPVADMWEITKKILSDRSLPRWPFIHLLNFSFKFNFDVDLHDVESMTAAARLSPRPLLLLGGVKDDVVPIEHGRRVFAAAKEPKEMHLDPQGDHYSNGKKEVFDKTIIPFLDRYLMPEREEIDVLSSESN